MAKYRLYCAKHANVIFVVNIVYAKNTEMYNTVKVNYTKYIIGSRPSDHHLGSVRGLSVRPSVCLFVCLFVCAEFSKPSLIRSRSNQDICYTAGSSCVPARPLGAG